jgi:hypothetical protein
MEDDVVTRLYKRIDKVSEEFDATKGELSDKLNSLHSDVRVLLETCKQRGKTCHSTVLQLDRTIRGNGGDGLSSRVSTLENIKSDKEKYSFLIIGAASTACISLLIALVIQFFRS